MKKIILPLILIAAGVILLALYFIPFGSGKVKIADIKNAGYIMPAAYKVYSNPDVLNGEYYLFKMLLTNDGKGDAQNVKVAYRIPNYIDWTDLPDIPKIYPGQNVEVQCYPRFKDDIVEKLTQSKENVEIKVTWNSGQSTTENFPIQIMGRNQFIYTNLPPEEIVSWEDYRTNADLEACFVTPDDPIVKYYASQVQEKILKGQKPSDDMTPLDCAKFLIGIYTATYNTHMVYSGDEGIPKKLGDIQSTMQGIRLPRDVIYDNTGLCIEFSLLYASILKHAGLRPVIFFKPGHAFPGVIVNNRYVCTEPTGVNGEGLGGILDPDSAFRYGEHELDDFLYHLHQGDPGYYVLDINQLEAMGIVPMELKDDESYDKKIDDYFAQKSTPNPEPVNQRQNTAYTSRSRSAGGGGGGNSNESSSVRNYNGIISFSYPAEWIRQDNPFPKVPVAVSYIHSSDNSSEIDVFNIPGASNADDAIMFLQKQFYSMGITVQYQFAGNSNGYSIYDIVSASASGYAKSIGKFRQTSNGASAIVVGGSSTIYEQMKSVYQAILSTVK